MIGQNDIPAEVFTLDDARQLLAFAQQNQLGRLAMWSANRDKSCGPNYPDVKVVSDACSGISQVPGEFDSILGTFGSGTAAGAGDHAPPPSPSRRRRRRCRRPATRSSTTRRPRPTPIWNPNQAYPKGTKVVWHKNVYQAKWYTIGDQPDLPVATADQTPWTLIGPVLPGDTPAPTPTLPAGTYPEWARAEVYVAGSRVMLDGVGYQAKYWTQGNQPGALPATPQESSPWELLATPVSRPALPSLP